MNIMEKPPYDNNTYSYIAAAMLLILFLGIYSYIEHTKAFKYQNPVKNSDAEIEKHPPADIYPLYSGLAWNNEENIITELSDFKIYNFKISSRAITHISNIENITLPFRKYYDEKLKKLGWQEAEKISTQVRGGAQWSYKKDQHYIILSYTSEQEKPYFRGPITCPCIVQFTIITGGNN